LEKLIKPMLALDVHYQHNRVFVQPKLDGVRCTVQRGHAYSRSLKLIPNKYIQESFSKHASLIGGLDGELIVGSPTDPDCYRKTISGVMSVDGEPDFTFYVYDSVYHCSWAYRGFPRYIFL
jgi:DNA ligase-1